MSNKQGYTQKFHAAHFPVGTVVEIENVMGGFTDGKYSLTTHTVAGIETNGPDSWILQFCEKSPIFNGLDGTNVQWVHRIVKRGDGTLTTEQQAIVDQYAEKPDPRKETLAYRFGEFLPSSKGTYKVYSLQTLISFYLYSHPKFNGDRKGNLIDQHALAVQLVKRFPANWVINEYGDRGYLINKRQFAKAFKAALAKSNVKRKAAQKADDQAYADIYEAEDYDYD